VFCYAIDSAGGCTELKAACTALDGLCTAQVFFLSQTVADELISKRFAGKMTVVLNHCRAITQTE
jgi:hypothetical protein